MDSARHWDSVYRRLTPDAVTWYQPHLEISLRLISEAAPRHDCPIIDVGGGESTLVDDLIARGYDDVSVLDISPIALDVAKRRLGAAASRVHWLCGDVARMTLERRRYGVWHDRAVFHFLTSADDRAAYVRQVAHSLEPGGHVIVATFGPAGPTQCSGLPVVRYDADALHDEFGARFELVKHVSEHHHTPTGAIQQFVYCYCNIVR